MENFFCCENCDKFVYAVDCVLYDIVDTNTGRAYFFECPCCELVQKGEIITEYKTGDINNAPSRSQEKRKRNPVHAKMYDISS